MFLVAPLHAIEAERGKGMKRCFKCKTEKPLSDFYRHPQMRDGHLNKCKFCAKIDVQENRAKRVEQYREYDKYRFQHDPRVRARHKRYARTKEGKEAIQRAHVRWRNSNPEKRAAHVILGNALRSGRVDKPNKCSRCGDVPEKRFLHGHHHDYAKPLDVEWICVWCHVEEHKE